MAKKNLNVGQAVNANLMYVMQNHPDMKAVAKVLKAQNQVDS